MEGYRIGSTVIEDFYIQDTRIDVIGRDFWLKKLSAVPPPQLTSNEIWQQVRYLPTVYEGEPYKPKNLKN